MPLKKKKSRLVVVNNDYGVLNDEGFHYLFCNFGMKLCTYQELNELTIKTSTEQRGICTFCASK